MIIGLSLLVFIVVLVPLSMGEVMVPDGYREWVHVRSVLIPQGSSLYHLSGGMEHKSNLIMSSAGTDLNGATGKF